ncbi:MAG: hypothetical protein C0497_06125 [Gemmatimonas sp.]|nr:hypothetical protein [Gemmatimonas sp.]
MSACHSPRRATTSPARRDPPPALTLRAQKARLDYLTGVSACRHVCGACDQCQEDAQADGEIAVLEAAISAAETAPTVRPDDGGRSAIAGAP